MPSWFRSGFKVALHRNTTAPLLRHGHQCGGPQSSVSGTVLTGLNNQVAPSPWVPLPASQARSCSCPTCLTRGMSKISRAKKGFRRVSATGSHACERITSRLGTIASTIDQQDIHTRVRTIEAPLMYSLVWASSAATLTPKSDLYVAGSR